MSDLLEVMSCILEYPSVLNELPDYVQHSITYGICYHVMMAMTRQW